MARGMPPQGRDTEHIQPHASKNTIKVKQPGPEIIKLFWIFNSAECTKFILLINVKGDGNPDDYYVLYERS